MTTKPDELEAMIVHGLADRGLDDDVWYQLYMGQLDPQQVAEDRARYEPPEALTHKLALFSPATDAERQRSLELLHRRYFAESDGTAPGSRSATPITRETSTSRAARSWPTIGAVVLLVAASLLLWIWSRSEPTRPLTDYQAELGPGGSGSMRDGSSQCYRMDQTITITLRPYEPFRDPVDVAMLVSPDRGSPRWVQPNELEQHEESGTLTIKEPVSDLGFGGRDRTLTFYVTREGEAPLSMNLEDLDVGVHPGVTVVRVSICIDG